MEKIELSTYEIGHTGCGASYQWIGDTVTLTYPDKLITMRYEEFEKKYPTLNKD